jgi:hypothetical protein
MTAHMRGAYSITAMIFGNDQKSRSSGGSIGILLLDAEVTRVL